jgi:hypothetical protein
MKYGPEHVARALEIMRRLLPDVSPQQEYVDLIAILETPLRWKEAHDQFSIIRVRITIPAERKKEWDLDRLFARVAENAAKTAYNCSGAKAPFDQASFERLLAAEAVFLERKNNQAHQPPAPERIAHGSS